MRDANEQRAAIGLGVEDAIQNGHALGLRAKVVVVDRGGSAIPLGASILEVPHQFPLLGVDADHRIALSAETPTQFADVLELSLAEGVSGPVFLRFTRSENRSLWSNRATARVPTLMPSRRRCADILAVVP